MGGVVSAITRSGGNAFHGDIHYYYYGNTLSTDPTQRLAIDPASQGPLIRWPRAPIPSLTSRTESS